MSVSAVMVSRKPGLDYIKFNWNKMTATEFEEHWKVKKMTKKADFIHMIQVGAASIVLLCPQTVFFDTSRSCSFGSAPQQLIPLQHLSSTASQLGAL